MIVNTTDGRAPVLAYSRLINPSTYLIPCFRAQFSWPARRRETLPITRSRVHVIYIDIPP